MDKKMGTAEEPAEPSESQPHDDDDDDDGIWMEDWDVHIPIFHPETVSCKVTGKEQSQGKGQGRSKASSQGKEGLNNEEACQSVAEETFTEVGKRVLNTPASAWSHWGCVVSGVSGVAANVCE